MIADLWPLPSGRWGRETFAKAARYERVAALCPLPSALCPLPSGRWGRVTFAKAARYERVAALCPLDCGRLAGGDVGGVRRPRMWDREDGYIGIVFSLLHLGMPEVSQLVAGC